MYQRESPSQRRVLADLKVARTRLGVLEPEGPNGLETALMKALARPEPGKSEYDLLIEIAARLLRRCEVLKEQA